MSLLAATTRLCEELDALSTALASGDGASLVAVEERIAMAIDAIPADMPIDGAHRAAVVAALLGVRAAVERCRVLGTGIADLAQASMIARGQHANYDHSGLAAGRQDLRGVSVDARL